MPGKRIVIVLIATALLLGLPTPLPAAPRPQVEIDAATYTVDSNSDAADANVGDGICATAAGTCTLRAAIQEANQDGTASTVRFASQTDITPGTYLPPILGNNTIIDASDQWNGTWPYGRPGVRITYNNASLGLLTIGADYCVVRGIEFSGSNSVECC